MRQCANASFKDSCLWVLLFLCLGFGQSLSAKPMRTSQVFEHIQSPDHPTVTVMTQDENGRIWLGSARGLFLFNGQELLSIPFKGRENYDITALSAFQDGYLIVGTRDGSLFRLNTYLEPMIPERIGHGNETTWDSITSFVKVNEALWFGTDEGLYYLESQTVAKVPEFDGESVLKLTAGRGGSLVLGTEEGVFRYVDGRRTLLAKVLARDLLAEMDGGVWIASASGLYHVFPDGGTPEHYQQGSHDYGITHSDTWSIARDGLGRLWVGHALGLDQFQSGQGFVHQSHFKKQHLSGRPELVHLLFTDSFGVMWAATRYGLDKLSPSQPEHLHLGVSDGLSNSRVHAVVETVQGVLWVGSNGGLDRLDFDGSRRAIGEGSEGLGLSSSRIRDLYLEKGAFLCVASDNGGLDRLVLEDERLERFPNAGLDIHRILRWKRGYLIAGGEDGLGLLDIEKETWLQVESPAGVNAMVLDRQDRLWIGTDKGLYLMTWKSGDLVYEQVVLEVGTVEVLSLHHDEQGLLWVGHSRGISSINTVRHFEQRHYSKMDGLPGDIIYAISRDLYGRLWAATSGGVASLYPNAEQFQTYGLRFGIGAGSRPTGATFRNHVGELYFGSMSGLHVLKPKAPMGPSNRPVSRITLLQDGREQKPFPKPSLAHALYADHLNLSLEVNHSDNPDRNMIAYRLLGRDEAWTKALGSNHHIAYKALKPGTYQFQMKTAASDGVWNGSMESLHIEVPKQALPYWEIIVLLNFVFLAFLGFWVVARIKRQEEARQKEQLRIRRDVERLQHLRKDFLLTVTRQFSSPLSEMVGISQSLLDGATGHLAEATRANLGMVAASGRRLLDLLHRLRHLSTVSAEEMQLQGSLNVGACVQVVLSDSKERSKGNHVYSEVPDNLPLVMGHEDPFQETLQYLVDFCLGLVKGGEIFVRAEAQGEGLKVKLMVSGPLLDHYKRAQALQAVDHVGSVASHELDGFHIGLAIANQLLSNMGATLKGYERQETLVLEFLMKVAEQTSESLPLAEDSGALKMPEPLTKAAMSGKKFHVLVVDDSQSSRQVINHYLSNGDFVVSEASSGLAALQMLTENPGVFDLILLDLVLPQMTGYEVCQKIRERHSIYELPVILLVSDDKPGDTAVGFSAGVNDFLSKPVSQDLLVARVQTHLHLLDVSRTLEDRVSRRTQQLQARNQEILKTQNQLILQAKMASLGTLTAGIAHEIKNPLNFVTNFAEIVVELAKDVEHTVSGLEDLVPQDVYGDLILDVEDLKQNTERIQVHGRRANNIVQSMMEVAGDDAGEFQEQSLNHLVDKYVNIAYQGALSKSQVRIFMEKDYDSSLPKIQVASNNFSRVVVNLVNNAIEGVLERQAAGDETYEPYVWVRTRAVEGGVELIIRDNGVGVEKQYLEQIFNPFFTTKPQGSGHIGLGLYFSYDVVTSQHNGLLELSSEAWNNTEVRVFLPA